MKAANVQTVKYINDILTPFNAEEYLPRKNYV